MILKFIILLFVISFIFLHLTAHNDLFRMSFGVFHGGEKMTSLLKFRVLTLLLTSRVSCLAHGQDNKYISWVYGVDRNICHEGH